MMHRLLLGPPTTIAGRLIAFSLFYAAAALVVASAVLWLIIANIVRDQVDQRLDVQIDAVRSALADTPAGAPLRNLDGPPFDRPGSGWYWQAVLADRRLTSRSLEGRNLQRPPQPFDWRGLLTGGPRPADGHDGKGQALHFRVSNLFIKGLQAEIVATAPRSALTTPMLRALMLLVPAMLVLGGALVAGIFLQVRFGLRPLRTITGQISQVSQGRSDGLDEPEAEELRPLVDEINRLIEQNRQRLAETRLQFANMAHGLKTPVASLFLALDGKSDPTGEARRLLGRIDRQIRHHLGRARAGVSAAGLASSTELREQVDDIVAMMGKVYADRGITVTIDIKEDLHVGCAAEDVQEIIAALIDNAFKWARSTVSIEGRAGGGKVVITVADDGPGISEIDMAIIGRPGVRLDETVPGNGFGLSIAKEVAELYGGRVSLETSRAPGLRAVVVLPQQGSD